MDWKIELPISVKAMNDTMGPNGSVPSVVFGRVPIFLAVNSILSDRKSRMDALSRARQEMATIIAEMRIRKALASQDPRKADIKIEPDYKI